MSLTSVSLQIPSSISVNLGVARERERGGAVHRHGNSHAHAHTRTRKGRVRNERGRVRNERVRESARECERSARARASASERERERACTHMCVCVCACMCERGARSNRHIRQPCFGHFVAAHELLVVELQHASAACYTTVRVCVGRVGDHCFNHRVCQAVSGKQREGMVCALPRLMQGLPRPPSTDPHTYCTRTRVYRRHMHTHRHTCT